jgi:hypothetical protein
MGFFKNLFKKPTGYIPSPPDKRDFNASSHIPVFGSSGANIDLELPELEADYQRGETCVSHADEVVKAQQEYAERGAWQRFDPYFLDNTRQPDQYQGTSGWYPREAKKNLQKFGICRRGMINSRPWNGKPMNFSQTVLDDASYQRIDTYFRINTRDEMISSVKFNGGFTIAIPLFKGFNTLKSFDDTLPILPLPTKNDKPYAYHQMAVQGIMFSHGGLKVLNSYGSSWGRRGYFVLPWDYPIEEMWGSKDKYLPIPEVATEDIILYIGKTTYEAGGKKAEMDVAPFIKPEVNRTFVPLRFVGQALGFMVNWQPEQQKIYLTNGINEMTFTIGQNYYFDNGIVKFLEPSEAPFIENNRTFIPLRVVAESRAFNRKVEWYGESQKIIIYKK